MDARENYRSASKIQPLPMPAPELDRLNIFIGRWHAEGYSYSNEQPDDSPYASAVKWNSEESYEWMSGRFFIVHRWDATVGSKKFKGIEIMGYDVARKEYFTRLYDNEGNVVKYAITLLNNTWKLVEPHTRTNIVFSEDGNTMTFNWEWKHEGGDWLPLCNRKAERVV